MKKLLVILAACAAIMALSAGCAAKRSITATFWMEDHLYVAYWESVSFTEGAKVVKCDLQRRSNSLSCKEQEDVTRVTAPPGLWQQLKSTLPDLPKGPWK